MQLYCSHWTLIVIWTQRLHMYIENIIQIQESVAILHITDESPALLSITVAFRGIYKSYIARQHTGCNTLERLNAFQNCMKIPGANFDGHVQHRFTQRARPLRGWTVLCKCL